MFYSILFDDFLSPAFSTASYKRLQEWRLRSIFGWTNTKKRYETTWVQGANESWRKWFCCRYLSELQGRHIYVLWGASTRKLSKYYEIWVGRLNPSVINIICYHLVLVWNEELLEWGTYEGSNKHLCRLLPHEFDSKIFEILTLLPQTCFFVK